MKFASALTSFVQGLDGQEYFYMFVSLFNKVRLLIIIFKNTTNQFVFP